MMELCGYNFSFDANALDSTPSNLNDITTAKIENAIYDNINVLNEAGQCSTTIPTTWTTNTILNCGFNNTINAGNVSFSLASIDALKIKRKIVGTYNWITLHEYTITNVNNMSLTSYDNLCANGIEYEYAVVPVSNNVEGNYITANITPSFDGYYICDYDTIYKLYYAMVYSTTTDNQVIGTLQPIGKQYPIIIKNSIVDYESGSCSFKVMGTNWETTHTIDRQSIITQAKEIRTFLKSSGGKILKDMNGNIWLIHITGNPSTDYTAEFGNGIQTLSFSWTEQGDYNTQLDLYNNNLTNSNI